MVAAITSNAPIFNTPWAFTATKAKDFFTPTTYKEAVQSAQRAEWDAAMQSEWDSLLFNNTFDILDGLPKGRKAIGSKWVYRVKSNSDGSVDKFKARFTAKGFSQKEGIDYNETYAAVVKMTSFRTLCSIAAQKGYHTQHWDVGNAFLNSTLDEEIYCKMPEGYKQYNSSGGEKVLKLKRGLYGLKQSPRQWNKTLVGVLCGECGLTQSKSDDCLFIMENSSDYLVCAVYVDDIVVVGSNMDSINNLKERMFSRFKMTDLGELKWFLGMEIKRDYDNSTLTINQTKYINDAAEKFDVTEMPKVTTPAVEGVKFTTQDCPKEGSAEQKVMQDYAYKSLMGTLLFACHTRPDVTYAVNALAAFMQNPGVVHYLAALRVLRYLHCTSDLGLTYSSKGNGRLFAFHKFNGALHSIKSSIMEFFGYVDSDWATDMDDSRSISGFANIFGGAAVSWGSKKQPTVALSSSEAEFMAATESVKDVKFLRLLLEELGFPQSKATKVLEDNNGCIFMSKNQGQHKKAKHINYRQHFIKDAVKDGDVDLTYVATKDQAADVLTKPLGAKLFTKFRGMLMGQDF